LRRNSLEYIKGTPKKLRDSSTQDLIITENPADNAKARGVHWNTQADSFYNVTPVIEVVVPTKMDIASAAARIYNMRVWYGHVVLPIKILLQKLLLGIS